MKSRALLTQSTGMLVLTAMLIGACSSGSSSTGTPSTRQRASGTSVGQSTAAQLAVPSTLANGAFPSVRDPKLDGSLRHVEVKLTTVATADAPMSLVPRPHHTGQLFLAERAGKVRLVTQNTTSHKLIVTPGALVDITKLTSTDGENGLLGLAFNPSGDTLYLSYTLANGDSRLDSAPITGSSRSPRIGKRTNLLRIDQKGLDIHKGGDLAVDPNGLLYVSFGDGGPEDDPESHGQNMKLLQGKILRIDPAHPTNDKPYGIPADNPFADGKGGAPEIYVSGLRNPWRFSLDPKNNDLWIGDVGQNALEEIDRLPGGPISAGANLGWSGYEATTVFDKNRIAGPTVPPIYEMSHDDSYCAVTGGFVYRGRKIPKLRGAYVFADLCHQGIEVLRATTPTDGIGVVTDVRPLAGAQRANQVISFASDADGELYTLDMSGAIQRIDPA